MNYELAKELKDAGFPQKELPYYVKDAFTHFGKEEVSPVSLSELIEACVEKEMFRYFALEKHSNDWRAGFVDGVRFFVKGNTPKEAVAKLWLELNKK